MPVREFPTNFQVLENINRVLLTYPDRIILFNPENRAFDEIEIDSPSQGCKSPSKITNQSYVKTGELPNYSQVFSINLLWNVIVFDYKHFVYERIMLLHIVNGVAFWTDGMSNTFLARNFKIQKFNFFWKFKSPLIVSLFARQKTATLFTVVTLFTVERIMESRK